MLAPRGEPVAKSTTFPCVLRSCTARFEKDPIQLMLNPVENTGPDDPGIVPPDSTTVTTPPGGTTVPAGNVNVSGVAMATWSRRLTCQPDTSTGAPDTFMNSMASGVPGSNSVRTIVVAAASTG